RIDHAKRAAAVHHRDRGAGRRSEANAVADVARRAEAHAVRRVERRVMLHHLGIEREAAGCEHDAVARAHESARGEARLQTIEVALSDSRDAAVNRSEVARQPETDRVREAERGSFENADLDADHGALAIDDE